MQKTGLLGKILSGSFLLFALWAFVPIIIELISKVKSLEDYGLLSMLSVLTGIAIFSLVLWLPEEKLQQHKSIRVTSIVLLILVSLAIFAFVYTSWLLLVLFFAGQYVWFKRMLKGKISTLFNVTVLVLISFLLSVFVFSIVYVMHT